MSFLDSLKQDALAVFQATANALHAQLANTLSQAGHAVTEDDHVDTLVQTASAASTGAASAAQASTTAPNYADAALATFTQSLTAAAVQFAQAHLPAKFQGVASTAVQAVSGALADGTVSTGEAVQAAASVAQAAVAAVAPNAAPIVDEAVQAVQAVSSGTTSAASVVASVASTALQAGETIAAAVADKALPGAGALVTAGIGAIEAALSGNSSAASAANTQGM